MYNRAVGVGLGAGGERQLIADEETTPRGGRGGERDREDVAPSSRRGDHEHAAIVGACGRIVHAIPAVRAARRGIRTTTELRLPTGRGAYIGTGGLGAPLRRCLVP